MEDKKALLEDTTVDESPDQAVGGAQPSARRRLLRQGAAVVAVTLVSRPVLAWHCKSPSAWGSEQLNPNTSLKTNAGHNSYADETWTISNWVSNTSRSGFGQPWVQLKNKYPAIYDKTTRSNYQFDYTKVTVGKLFSVVNVLARPGGMSDSAKVKDILSFGTDLQKYTIVAQLNYLLLAPLAPPNDLDRCVTLVELKEMATGVYSPPNMPNVVWGPAQIKDYLYNNWIVIP